MIQQKKIGQSNRLQHQMALIGRNIFQIFQTVNCIFSNLRECK